MKIRLADIPLSLKMAAVPVLLVVLMSLQGVVNWRMQQSSLKATRVLSEDVEPVARLSSQLMINLQGRLALIEQQLRSPSAAIQEAYRTLADNTTPLFQAEGFARIQGADAIRSDSQRLDQLFTEVIYPASSERSELMRTLQARTLPELVEYAVQIRATLDPNTAGELPDWTILLSNHMQAALLALNAYVASAQPEDQEALRVELLGAENAAQDIAGRVRQERHKRWISGIRKRLEQFRTSVRTIFAQTSQLEQTLANEVAPLRTRVVEALGQEQKRVFEKLPATSQTVESALSDSLKSTIWMIGVSLVLATLLTILVTRVVVRPLHTVVETMEDIAQGGGDLTRRLDYSGRDELGRLARAFNHFVGLIRDICLGINQATAQLNSAAGELNQAAHAGTQAIDAQRAEFEAVAAATEELSASFTQVAQTADNLSENATRVEDGSGRGRTQLEQTISQLGEMASQMDASSASMAMLAEDSQKVSDVLAVINTIAEQTNLLALNAAIEAARAGEHGRGFAVVADEVRQLAMRTRDSTEEIRAIMESLQQGAADTETKMSASNTMSRSSLEAIRHVEQIFEDTHHAISEAASLIAQVHTSADQQAQTAQDIARRMHTVEELLLNSQTQVTATNDSAATVAGLAETISQQVGRFRT